jgi:hypothetical protein
VDELTAYIHPGHEASIGIARALGLSATSVLVDGEVRWTDADTPSGMAARTSSESNSSFDSEKQDENFRDVIPDRRT